GGASSELSHTAAVNTCVKDHLSHRSQKRANPRRHAMRPLYTSDVSCDICHRENSAAVKSCLTCQVSYCETHLTPHLQDPVMMTHRLTDPATFSHLCRIHNKLLDFFCKEDQMPVCVKCTEKEHRHHFTVPIENEGKRIKSQIGKNEVEIQQMIEARLRKIEEIKITVEQSKAEKDRQICSSTQVFTMVVSQIERNQALLVEKIQQKQEALERRAEECLKQLRKETEELQRRRSKLQYLANIEDPVHILQSVPTLSVSQYSKDMSEVQLHSDIFIGMVRRTFSKLVDACHELERKLSAEEISKANEYAVDITLDPVTASGWLLLSSDGKKVSLSNNQRRLPLPPDPRRFDSCVSVLGKQRFTSGKHYWVVQVGDKTDWDLGVAKESITRKGAITVRPDSGYWAICRRKGGSLNACAGPSIALHLEETPQKVGVFLDYEEGLVSFYNTEAKTHIYTYSRCKFTEPLYPYLNPCLHDNGKNTAPLVICPVEVEFT
ncbi:hypothetical protein INR49_002449, partial [Caranx melampygus]